jgi:CPA2 family monovalent cation:H+ antiporter-2
VHDLPLLLNLAIVLAYALVGGLLARRIGLPTIVGYLVAGVALGPFTPGFQAATRPPFSSLRSSASSS